MQKYPDYIVLMKEGGRILSAIMRTISTLVTVGNTGNILENAFDQQLKIHKVNSAFKGFEGYPFHLCIGVNVMVVHGFPSDIPFMEGDLISVDMGLIYKGYYLDMARTFIVGRDIHNYQSFVATGREAFIQGMMQARAHNRIGDISSAVQQVMEKENTYSIVREMVGHGVGRRLHEKPDIPGYGDVRTGPAIKEFQTLAIEVIAIRSPNPNIIEQKDGWQTVSESGEVSLIMENTVFVGKDRGYLLTDD